jgi:predicted DNA-binding transcriptional regulator YafY
MKLYNLFESVILEEVEKAKRLITEGVSTDEVIAAIDGMYNVNIMYRDPGQDQPSKRYIQVYNLAKTKGGNDAIRAYQIFGGSKTTPNSGAWKIFRLDRIESWLPTNKKWYNPVSDTGGIPTYNQNGDNSMASVSHKVNPSNFNRQRSAVPQNNVNKNELNK